MNRALATLDEGSIRVFNSIPTNSIGESVFIDRVFDILLFVGGVAAFIYLLAGAFQYATAGGDQDKASTGRQTIIYSVVGLIIILSSLYIIRASRNLLSVNGGQVEQKF